MESGSDQPRNLGQSLGAGLLIVTGASHTGKSSVIEAVLPALEPPVALLSVDEVLVSTLVRPPGDQWEQIPLAYELIERQADTLLEQGWLVIIESTFTYVPPEGEPSFHENALRRFVGLADRHHSCLAICQLRAPLQEISARSMRTNRLAAEVVAATSRLHDAAELPAGTFTVSTANQGIGEAAKELRRHISTRLSE
jgi:predicted kinase